MIDDDEYGAVGGMRIDSGNRSTCRKPSPVPFCPPQIPHVLIWARTRATAVGSRRLRTWAMARHKSRSNFLTMLSDLICAACIYSFVCFCHCLTLPLVDMTFRIVSNVDWILFCHFLLHPWYFNEVRIISPIYFVKPTPLTVIVVV
jgi:hypothetical protein